MLGQLSCFLPYDRDEYACVADSLALALLLTQLTWRCSTACSVLCPGHPRRPFRLISRSFHPGYPLSLSAGASAHSLHCPPSSAFPISLACQRLREQQTSSCFSTELDQHVVRAHAVSLLLSRAMTSLQQPSAWLC